MLSRKRQERKMMMKTAKTLGIAGSVPKREEDGGTVNHDWNIPSFCPLKTMRGLVLLGDMSFWK